jgi:hypothetical protein
MEVSTGRSVSFDSKRCTPGIRCGRLENHFAPSALRVFVPQSGRVGRWRCKKSPRLSPVLSYIEAISLGPAGVFL